MLPGFRFLFITTVMSASVLVFAIGAAALLRATHDSFATFPTRRAPQEQVFVKPQFNAPTPTIALLRVEAEPERVGEPALADVANIAASPTNEAAPALAIVAALNFPDPPAPAIVDLDMLRREVMQSTTIAAVETMLAAEPAAAASEMAAADPAPEQTASITSSASDHTTKLAAEQRKKAEAAKLRARKLESDRRARVAKIAAQRRRIAAARTRATRQTQTQTQAPALFNPVFGTN